MRTTPFDYYMLCETVVSEDVAMSRRKILSENTVNVHGLNLFTVTYEQVLQDFNVRNWNGRVYDDKTVIGAIENNPLIQHDLKMGTWTGEYGHPQIEKGQNELARQMTINPTLACNTIDKYWVEGNFLIGKCTTLAGGWGETLRDRILTNYPAMASSRAIGGVDKTGKVLPGYTLITFDTVIRPSHKTAYQRNDIKVNDFNQAMGNSMSESAVKIDIVNDPSFKDFLLSESASKQQINMLCDTLHLNYNTMRISENAVKIDRICENMVETVVIPLNRLINAEYYNLF